MMSELSVMPCDTDQQYISQYWAGKLIQCLQKMGELHTNAVLLLLDGATQIKAYQHYPKSAFTFGHGDWKVYYHCHKSPENEMQEHGHFHFFTRLETTGGDPDANLDKWSHVIAMSMNDLGQPTRLFTTNLWVTDGEWFNPILSQQQFNQLRGREDDDLSSMWFKHLLLLFKNEIDGLLSERDRTVEKNYPNNHQQCFIDRSIYYLSSLEINLNEKLNDVFQPGYQENS